MNASLPTVDMVRATFDYDPQSGALSWRVASGGKSAGSAAGFVTNTGYVGVGFCGKTFAAHRLAWVHVRGVWPSGQIDHINGKRADNRLENLRDVSQSVNMQNQRHANKSNLSSGLLGVTYHKRCGKWQAAIMVNKCPRYLGLHESAEAAHQAYLEAKRAIHPGGML